MRKRLPVILIMLVALSLLAAGCGDDDEDTTATTTTPTATGGGGGDATEVSMTEFSFDPGDFSVSEGDSIEAVNDGAIVHNFTVEGEDLLTEDLDAGGSEDLTVDLAPGDYEFLCTIGDHAERGMTGTLTVE